VSMATGSFFTSTEPHLTSDGRRLTGW
jgi:hypothetical protein